MRVVGLTGNIASGKSEVSKILRELGAKVIDMDSIGKEIQDNNEGNVIDKILKAFGNRFCDNGVLNRRLLGNYIFSNKEALNKLNSIMIPMMTGKLKEILSDERKKKTKIVVIDAAILFEAEWDKFTDEIWVVYAPKNLQIERLLKRENITRKEAEIRVDAQMPIREKMLRADFVIDNSGNLGEVTAQVMKLWKRIKNFT